ncbi:hypothetical protein SRHO_G00281980 [Serrasalmus rhombeus]
MFSSHLDMARRFSSVNKSDNNKKAGVGWVGLGLQAVRNVSGRSDVPESQPEEQTEEREREHGGLDQVMPKLHPQKYQGHST